MPAYSGHAPGHVRDTFLAALDAYADWKAGEPEPTVEHEVDYALRKLSLCEACGLLWNCNDVLPHQAVSTCEEAHLPLGRRTYAAAARAMHASIKKADV
jgi:hypothetical protein